jgi:two-component system, chemotaxis family, CheB/CheR fusion protein
MDSPVPNTHPLIVGVGASAGGLAAFKTFLANTPADTGMAFVLIQHLSPNHKSMLVELLGSHSPLRVVTAADGVSVEENCVYVIPPDTTLTIKQGVLQLETPAPAREHRRPIDTFLVSLAEDQGERAIGIVLSGVGSDGSVGIRSIKEHGGLTLAQAEFDHHALSGMPGSAAATGMVDHILPVEAMPGKLIEYNQHMSDVAPHKDGGGTRSDIQHRLPQITELLRAGVKHDFSGYKEATLIRRLQRRMQVLQLESIDAYLERLQTAPEEAVALFRDLLIGVTEFFRDPEAFEALQTLAIRPMLAAKTSKDCIRVWIAGCSTGEEVYSIAILLKETLGEHNSGTSPDIKIFATDIDTNALACARAGRYKTPVTGLSAQRLERWFSKDGADFIALPEIRELCIFSAHSLIKDPPFSRLDLITCRNVLIYFDSDLQGRVMRTFHYALNPGGTLFLGPSESIGRFGNLFTVLDKKNRILHCSETGRTLLPSFQSPASSLARGPPAPAAERSATIDDNIDSSVKRVMEQYAPAYFVIDRNHEILRFSGSEARHYLEPSPGRANLNLFRNLHKSLRPVVRSAVQQAVAQQETIVTENLTIRINGKSRQLTLIVEPIIETNASVSGVCVVAFRDSSPTIQTGEQMALAALAPDTTEELEKELNATRGQLRAASDELETTIEDMRSTTEEFQVVNEELQSSNEELETAKEELQSINEELQTVNIELSSKNDQTIRLNSDLKNLLDSTRVAAVFLDDDLHIRHYTPALTEIFPVRDTDRGRPITDIVNLVAYEDLKRDVDAVRTAQTVIERDVSLKDTSATFLMRIRPYRTITNKIDGFVLTFFDITERHRADEQKALLAKELQHRTANLFAVIMSIANRTLTGDRPIEMARDVFTARLKALANANALLTIDLAEGGALEDIVSSELASFSARITIQGLRIVLSPSATQGFALIVHELATNAMKHGALSNKAGRVTVTWSLVDQAGQEPRLAFRWQERGGPPVEPPGRKGFGSKLLERAIDTSAKPAVFDYACEGLTYDLDVLLASICDTEWLSRRANAAVVAQPALLA